MKYKHKITGEEATLLEDYYQVDGDVVPKRFIEDSCDWEKLVEKDYEIIRYGDEKGNLWDNGECIASYLGDGKTHIFSVKRLSDGEVFTVDDIARTIGSHPHTITSIEIRQKSINRSERDGIDRIWLNWEKNAGGNWLESTEKYIERNEKKYSLKDMVKIANHWAYIKSVTPEVALKVIEEW